MLFVPFAAAFLLGLRRAFGRVAANAEGGLPRLAREIVRQGSSGLRQLLTWGFLQRRLRSLGWRGWAHVALSWGIVVLFLGSLVVLVDDHVLPWLGTRLPTGLLYQGFQAALDVAGLALLAGAAAGLSRTVVGRRVADRAAVPLLLTLLLVGVSGFVLEGLRLVHDGGAEASRAFVGRAIARWIGGSPLLEGRVREVYASLWWSHALVAFAVIAVVPFTRLRHALLAPLHLVMARAEPQGELTLPFDLREVVASGAFDVQVGAGTAAELGWRIRLELACCTACGECELACPAVAAGTPLSPRRLMASLWDKCPDRAREPLPRLVDGTISEEAVWACTLCGACSEACPVLLRPWVPLVEIRRDLVSASRLPPRASALLGNLASSSNPYGAPHREREQLAVELGVPTLAEQPDVEWLYWIGCSATYDSRARQVARSMVDLLRRAGVRFGILGAEERCTGDAARRLGEEGRFQELALANLEVLERYGVRQIVTHCAHCFNTLGNEYPQLGGRFHTVHHSAMLDSLLREGRLEPLRSLPGRAALHDACYACRFNGLEEEPRRLLARLPGLETVELAHSRRSSSCCGAGGATYWYDSRRDRDPAAARIAEAVEVGADTLAVECPFCLRALESSATGQTPAPRVRDVAELLAEACL